MTSSMSVTVDVLKSLIRVSKAHAVRAYCRKVTKEAKQAQAEAEADYRSLGGFEDCGPSYEADFTSSKRAFDAAVRSQIAAEKAYKGVRLTAIEEFPQIAAMIDAFVISADEATTA